MQKLNGISVSIIMQMCERVNELFWDAHPSFVHWYSISNRRLMDSRHIAEPRCEANMSLDTFDKF